MIYDFLRKVPLFEGLEDVDLDQLCQQVETIQLKAGENLFEEGDEGDRAYVIEKGELEVYKISNDREVLLAVMNPGRLIGEMALLEAVPRTASIRARKDSVLHAITKDQLDQLMESSPSATKGMFETLLGRLRENQTHMRQSEKMAQLGTLTAGVAHELNNPSAAVQRGADQLQSAIADLNTTYAQITRLQFSEEQLQTLDKFSQQVQEKANRPLEMDALVRSDREYEMETWLEDHNVEDAWQIAPNMVNLDFNEDALNSLAEEFPAERLICITKWLNATFNVYSLLKEIGEGAGRLSAIVKSLKSYSYLDQAPVQSVNIHEGLDNTLLIMHNKLKLNVDVKREYTEDLPIIHGYGGELNQVWTNIIDNAADALAEKKNAKLVIRTRQEVNWVIVEFEDNGPGIPKENLDKIFDSFFTTKPPGKGTGLGLDISYKIIVQKHHGDIKVQSKSGQTIFSVWLPLNFEES